MKTHNVLPSPSWRDNDDAVDLKKSVRVIKIISQTAQCFHSMVEFFCAFRAAFSCSVREHVYGKEYFLIRKWEQDRER